MNDIRAAERQHLLASGYMSWSSSNAIDKLLDKRIHHLFTRSLPPVLYHYTSWAGAAGILGSQQLRLSAHDGTNDPYEIRTASQTILNAADVAISQYPSPMGDRAFEVFLNNYTTLHVTRAVGIFLTCFSSARDAVVPWARYGKGGEGVALGFRAGLNEPPPHHQGFVTLMLQVEYSEDLWNRRVSDLFSYVALLLAGSPPDEQTLALGASALFRGAAFAEMSAKRPEWNGEQEFRLVGVAEGPGRPPDVKVLNDRRDVEARVREPERLMNLAEVIVGPNQDFDQGAETIRCILSDSGYQTADGEYPSIIRSVCEPVDDHSAPLPQFRDQTWARRRCFTSPGGRRSRRTVVRRIGRKRT